jgi:uncharacterized membrane protein
MDRDDTEAEADRVRRTGLRKMALFATLFLAWQVAYLLLSSDPGERVRNVDVARVLGFLVWVMALLALFATGGAMFRYRRLRPFLGDERAVALRARACQAGFWVMIGLCMVGYVATLWLDLRVVDVVHLVLSGGVLAVLVAQLLAERG